MQNKRPNVVNFYGRKYTGGRPRTLPIFLVVLVPLFMMTLIFFTSYDPKLENFDFSLYSSLLIGNGIGLIYHLIIIFSKSFRYLFIVVATRMKDFFVNLKYKFKFAFICYKDDLIENGGIVFWYFLIVMILNLILFITGLVNIIPYL